MKVKIKKLNESAVVPYKTHKPDFGYDCVATSEEQVAPNVWKYGIGLAFEVDINELDPEFIISLDARSRSSVWKTGMILSNCVGTIDELYRGEVCAVFYHIMPDMPRYKIGDRIMQIKLGMTEHIEFEEVNELSETDRGACGYGSTGK